MIANKFLLHWIARAFLDVILPHNENVAEALLEQAEQMSHIISNEGFEGIEIDSASMALDIVLAVARCVFNDESIVGVPDLVVMTGVEDTFEITEEMITQMLVFAVSSFDCPSRESFVRNILSMDQETQEFLMHTIQTTLQQQAGNSTEEEADHTPLEEENMIADDELQTDYNGDIIEQEEMGDDVWNSSTIEQPEPTTSTADYKVPKQPMDEMQVCSSCQFFEQLVEKLKTEKLQERKTLETEITTLKNGLAMETSRLVDAELVLQEKDRLLKEFETKLVDHEHLQGKLEELSGQIAEKIATISSLQDQLDVDRTKLEKFDAMEKNLTKMKEKLSDLKEVQQQLKAETEAHSQTYQSLIAAEQTVQELRPFQSQVEEYRLELAEQAIALSEAQMRLKEAESHIQRLQANISAMEAGKQAMLSSQSHLAEELQATAEELRSRERFTALGEGMSEFNPVLMQELSKLRAENADLWNKLDRTSLDAVEKLQREVADQKAIAKSLTDKWQTTKTHLEHTARDLDQTRRQLLEMTIMYQTLQQTKEEHDAMMEEDIATQIDAKTHLFATLTQTQTTLRETQAQLQDTTGKRKREQEEHIATLATLHAEHETALAHLAETHSQAVSRLTQEHAGVVAEAEHRLLLLQTDLDQEVVKRRKVERLKKLYETESQRQRLQLQHLTASQDAHGGGSYAQGDFDVAAKEIRSLQEKLDEAHKEVQLLKTQVASQSQSVPQKQQPIYETVLSGQQDKENAVNRLSATTSSATSSSLLRKPAVRVLNPASSSAASSVGNDTVGGVAGNAKKTNFAMLNYAEQAELHDKQLEQLAREKRELLSKSLEENKEKMELTQRLLALDKENAQLKADLRKRTLEKERLERSMLKSGKISLSEVTAEH